MIHWLDKSRESDPRKIRFSASLCSRLYHRNNCYFREAAMERQRSRAPSQYPKRRLIVRSREVSKPRDWYFKLSYRFEIWQAHRQQSCRSACQISERSDNSKYKSRDFETLRDLTKRRLFGYWDRALVLFMVDYHYQVMCSPLSRSTISWASFANMV